MSHLSPSGVFGLQSSLENLNEPLYPASLAV